MQDCERISTTSRQKTYIDTNVYIKTATKNIIRYEQTDRVCINYENKTFFKNMNNIISKIKLTMGIHTYCEMTLT